jgi:hypothetical protein
MLWFDPISWLAPFPIVGGGGNWDIDFALLGPDLDTLNGYAERLRTNAPNLDRLDDLRHRIKRTLNALHWPPSKG